MARPALADLADRSSLLAEAARLDESRLEAQETRIEGLLAAGDQARAISETEGLLADHPWRERLWGLVMLAYYREGRQADALNAFQRAREILAEEVGIVPRRITASRAFLADVWAGLDQIGSMPTLIVWGDADFAFRAKDRQRLERVFPDHETVVVEGAGHFVQSDAPDRFAEAIRHWRSGLHHRAEAASSQPAAENEGGPDRVS